MKKHIIYVPGLGDGYDPLRRFGLFFWRRRNVYVTHVPMHWLRDDDTAEDKLSRIKKAMDKHPSYRTTVVGESAGGALALVAYLKFEGQIDNVITICGMNQGASSVSGRLYQKNKSFKDVMQQADRLVPTMSDAKKEKVRTIYSTLDHTVRPKDTLIDGVNAVDIRVPGHLLAIAVVLFFKYGLVIKP